MCWFISIIEKPIECLEKINVLIATKGEGIETIRDWLCGDERVPICILDWVIRL